MSQGISKSRMNAGNYTINGRFKSHVRVRIWGFTLVEALVTLSIAAVLVVLAAPGMLDFLDKRRAKGPAETLYGDMQFAKAEALKRGRPVRIVFIRDAMDGDPWCYGLTHAASCDCRVGAGHMDYCFLDIEGNGYDANVDPVRINSDDLWQADPDEPSPVVMDSVTYLGGNPTLTFNVPYGTANAGNVEFHSERGYKLRLVTAGIGRIRICSPAGDGHMWGYPEC